MKKDLKKNMENYVTYELAKLAEEKGLKNVFKKGWIFIRHKGSEYEAPYWSTVEPNRNDKEISDIQRDPNITYPQLIDWVFNDAVSIIALYTSDDSSKEYLKTFNEWLEFWYNLLKDCPLKYEFKGRLLEWFRKNDYILNPVSDEETDKFGLKLQWYWDDSIQSFLRSRQSEFLYTYEEAEHKGIKEIFKLMKNE